MRCIWACIEKNDPRGHPLTTPAAISRIWSKYTCMRSPWNCGSSRRRPGSECDVSSIVNTVEGPATGLNTLAFASPACSNVGGDGEHPLQERRRAYEHPRAQPREADREHAAECTPTFVQERQRVARVAPHLYQRRGRRTRRQPRRRRTDARRHSRRRRCVDDGRHGEPYATPAAAWRARRRCAPLRAAMRAVLTFSRRHAAELAPFATRNAPVARAATRVYDARHTEAP